MNLIKIISIVLLLLCTRSQSSFCEQTNLEKSEHNSSKTMLASLIRELSTASVKKFIPKQKITTKSDLAQLYFQYGLLFKYAFDHLSANHLFTEATKLDPMCAMCYWGIALTIPQSINGAYVAEYSEAHNAIEKALELSKNSTMFEKDIISALNKRFVKKNGVYVQNLEQYADYMRNVVAKYPDNEDAASLLTDVLIEIGPYGFWNKDGTPQKNTHEMIKLTDQALMINPFHPGANHYKIHIYEFSKTPDHALDSAIKLTKIGTMSYAFTHLVHMPSHIFNRLGMYDAMIKANKKAINIGNKYILSSNDVKNYIEENHMHSMYVLHYALALRGQYVESCKLAQELVLLINEDRIKSFPYYRDRLIVTEMFNNVKFSAWDKILQMKDIYAPGSYEKAIYHYARGLAYHYTGIIEKAQKEKRDMDAIMHNYFNLSDKVTGPFSKKLMEIANLLLSAALVENTNPHEAENLLYKAIFIQDNYNFSEPVPWYFPIRDALGAMLIKQNRFKEAKEVFTKSLDIVKNSGWALWGLYLAKHGLGEKDALVKKKFQSSWKHADIELSDKPQLGAGFMVNRIQKP